MSYMCHSRDAVFSSNIFQAASLHQNLAIFLDPSDSEENKIQALAHNLLVVQTDQGLAWIPRDSCRGLIERIVNSICIIFFRRNYLRENKEKVFSIVTNAKLDLVRLRTQSLKDERSADQLRYVTDKINEMSRYIENAWPVWVHEEKSFFAAKQFVNFAVRKPVDSTSSVDLKQYYGQNVTDALLHGYARAASYLEADPIDVDTVGLMALAEARRIMCDIWITRNDAASFVKRVHALSDPGSNQVVQIDQGAAFFFAGGTLEHYITCDIRRQNDRYYFFIHNRGGGVEDEELHGSIQFYKDGLRYRRTSVCIEVSREHLTEDFFQELMYLNANVYDMKSVYSCIKEHLLQKEVSGKRGSIIKSPHETRLEEIFLKNPLLASILSAGPVDHIPESLMNLAWGELFEVWSRTRQALIDTNVFSQLQVYGSCTDSNRYDHEVILCGRKTRLLLKQYTMQQLVSQVSNAHFEKVEDQQSLISLGHKRICELQKKIDGT